MRRVIAAAALVFVLPGVALAQDAPSDIGTATTAAGEKSTIKPVGERKIGKRKRPTVEKRGDKKARKKRAIQVSYQIPARLRAALERKIDARISRNVAEAKRLRKVAIRLLRKFLRETPKDVPEVPEALLRLGELEWEHARDQFLLDFNRWEKTPADQRGAPPSPKYSQPRKRFARVLSDYKSFRDYDLALYVDGFLAQEEGKLEESLDRFNKILAWFPGSRFVPDAHMVRAEFEFTKEYPNYSIAFAEYERVLKHKDTGLHDIALFKSAWCLWRMGQSDEAARRFLGVFKRTDEAGKTAKGRQSELDELQQEALKNLVAVFVEDERHSARDMHRFLVKAGGEKFAGRIVKALAEAFYDQSHYERGVEAYRLLLKLEPSDPEGYKWALAVAQGHSTMEDWKQLEKDYRWVLKEFTVPASKPGQPPKQGGAWTRVQKAPTLKRAEDAIEQQLRDDGIGLHAKAQDDKTSRAEYDGASRLYSAYLSHFSKHPKAYEVFFNHGEINFYHLENDEAAADSYLAAVRLQPQGKYSRDALYNALAALEQARVNEFEAAKKKGEKQKESPTDKKLTEAMELYVATYPNDKDVPELLFRQGKLYYDYEVYDPAVRQWGLLLEKYPNSKFAGGAGELILDSFNKSKDYDNIETWARRLKSAPSFQTPQQQKRLDTLIVQAVFKLGEQHGERGEHKLAAAAYLRAAREFPQEPRAAQAAVNAEVSARKAGDLATLDAAAALLIRDHKARDEAAQGVWIAATTYQSVGLFSRAAEYHEVIVATWPKYEHHKDAAYNAVLLRTTTGDHAKAIEDGNQYKKHYPREKEVEEVTFLMGKAHEKAEKWKDAERLYSRYSRSARSKSAEVEALVRLATVRVELSDDRGAKSALSMAVRVGRGHKKSLDEDGKYFAAKARYMQGERILADFEKVKIEGSVEQLKTRLKKKSKLLKQAADTFLDAVEMGVAEWTTASLYQIGFTYESFSQALLNSPPPESLSPPQAELYRQQIDEFVIPIEERSIEAYESGWLKAVELGIFNSWTAKMRAALGRLTSEMYPPMKEIGFKLLSKGPSPMPALIEGPRRGKDGRSLHYFVGQEPPEEKDAEEEAETGEKPTAGEKAAPEPEKADAAGAEKPAAESPAPAKPAKPAPAKKKRRGRAR